MSQESKKQVPGSIFFALKCKFSVNLIKKSFTKRHWQDGEKHTY